MKTGAEERQGMHGVQGDPAPGAASPHETHAPSLVGRLPPHEIRAATMGDRAYIIDSWLQSYRKSQFGTRLPSDVYWSRYGQAGLVEALVERSSFIVACLPDDPTWIYAWMCHEMGTLHYVHVRREFQRLGFGSRLIKNWGLTPMHVTHMTPEFSRLAAGRVVKFDNPFVTRKERAA